MGKPSFYALQEMKAQDAGRRGFKHDTNFFGNKFSAEELGVRTYVAAPFDAPLAAVDENGSRSIVTRIRPTNIDIEKAMRRRGDGRAYDPSTMIITNSDDLGLQVLDILDGYWHFLVLFDKTAAPKPSKKKKVTLKAKSPHGFSVGSEFSSRRWPPRSNGGLRVELTDNPFDTTPANAENSAAIYYPPPTPDRQFGWEGTVEEAPISPLSHSNNFEAPIITRPIMRETPSTAPMSTEAAMALIEEYTASAGSVDSPVKKLKREAIVAEFGKITKEIKAEKLKQQKSHDEYVAPLGWIPPSYSYDDDDVEEDD